MKRFARKLCTALFAILAFGMCIGCENTFVTDAARDSLASFLSSIFDTAVTSVVVG